MKMTNPNKLGIWLFKEQTDESLHEVFYELQSSEENEDIRAAFMGEGVVDLEQRKQLIFPEEERPFLFIASTITQIKDLSVDNYEKEGDNKKHLSTSVADNKWEEIEEPRKVPGKPAKKKTLPPRVGDLYVLKMQCLNPSSIQEVVPGFNVKTLDAYGQRPPPTIGRSIVF
jgi:hypothetical protein